MFWASRNGCTIILTVFEWALQESSVILRRPEFLIRTIKRSYLCASVDATTIFTASATKTSTDRLGVSLSSRFQLSSGGCKTGTDGGLDEGYGGRGDLVPDNSSGLPAWSEDIWFLKCSWATMAEVSKPELDRRRGL